MQAETSDVTMLLRELRQIGEEPPRALLDRVKALGPLVVRPLIALATDEALHRADGESPEVWAPLHAIHLLGELGAAEAVEPLLPLLGWQDDALSEGLPKALGQIGPAAVSPLRAVLFDRTQDLWAREGAASALAQIAQQHPDLRDEVIAILVGRLDPAESQTPADETLNGLIIGRLLDLEATEAAPAIQQAFAEDRVDQRIVDLASARHELELAPELVVPFPRRGPGVRLWLRCTACGYERAHDVAKVYCDLGTLEQRQRGEETSYSEFVIPQRITCPKCSAVDQYALTTEAHLALAAEGLVQAAATRRRACRTMPGSARWSTHASRWRVTGRCTHGRHRRCTASRLPPTLKTRTCVCAMLVYCASWASGTRPYANTARRCSSTRRMSNPTSISASWPVRLVTGRTRATCSSVSWRSYLRPACHVASAKST
jgi:hypothetical protein